MNNREEAPIVYRGARFIMGIFLRVWCRATRSGVDHVQQEGGCLVVSNHVSYLDPPALTFAIPHRHIRFMARDTLFASRFGHWFFTGIQAISLDRNQGDLQAIRSALRILKAGGVVALFPEGTRSEDGQLKEAKRGIGFLIAKANAPVVPVYQGGTYEAYPKHARFIRPSKIHIEIGPPIDPEALSALVDKKDYEAIAKLVMSHIAGLKPDSTS